MNLKDTQDLLTRTESELRLHMDQMRREVRSENLQALPNATSVRVMLDQIQALRDRLKELSTMAWYINHLQGQRKLVAVTYIPAAVVDASRLPSLQEAVVRHRNIKHYPAGYQIRGH